VISYEEYHNDDNCGSCADNGGKDNSYNELEGCF
jgi:hypothetical protein